MRRDEIMTIKAAKTAPRERTTRQNGLPEPVPYVYRQQQRRNTYAARIAERNTEGRLPPPALSFIADESFRVEIGSGEFQAPGEGQELKPADPLNGTG
jgi:hypothetical protein